MKLAERIRGWITGGTGSTAVGSAFASVSQWEKAPSRTTQGLLKAYATSPWLRAVVGKIGDSIAGTGWMLLRRAGNPGPAARRLLRQARTAAPGLRHALVRRAVNAGDLEPIDEHPVLERIRKPNPLLQGNGTWHMAALHMDLAGELWLLKEFRGSIREVLKKDVPDALWPILPTWVTRMPSPANQTVELTLPGDGPKSLPLGVFVWAVRPAADDPYGRGSAVAHALATDLDVDEYAAGYARSFFFNNAIPPYLITGEGLGKNEPDIVRLEQRFQEKTAGLYRRFIPYFLSKKVEVHELGKSLSTLGLPELRDQERNIIQQVYGVAPEILGIIENSNRATIETAMYLFSVMILVPRLELLKAVFQAHLVDALAEPLVIEYENPVQEDKEFHLKVMQAQPHAFLVDEWRRLAGLDELPNGQGRVHVFGTTGVLIVPEGELLDLAEGAISEDEAGAVPLPDAEEEPGASEENGPGVGQGEGDNEPEGLSDAQQEDGAA